MEKSEILTIFDELLEEYQFAAETVFDMTGGQETSYLEDKVNDFSKRLFEALNS